MLIPEIVQFLIHYMATFVYLIISCGTLLRTSVLAARSENENELVNLRIAYFILFFFPIEKLFNDSSGKLHFCNTALNMLNSAHLPEIFLHNV